jgi:hypothetical protein
MAGLAAKSTLGMLSQEEPAEYQQLVRLKDWLSGLKR